LRALGKTLSQKAAPRETAASTEDAQLAQNPALEDIDDGPDPQAPRLSIALDEDEDDSFHVRPPRLSQLEDLGSFTSRPLERGRRAYSEDPRERLSTGRRLSERFNDLNEFEMGEETDYDTVLGANLGAAVDALLNDEQVADLAE
jgi:hypothetical protein